jgi:hypothetical protein
MVVNYEINLIDVLLQVDSEDGTNRCNYQIELQTFKMYKNYKVGVNCNNHYNQKKFT